MSGWKAPLRNAWSTVLIILLAVAAMFPIMATLGKSVFRYNLSQPLTLDGMAYMQYATQYEGNEALLTIDPSLAPFSLEGDYQVIRWLQENIQGSPIIMEGMSESTEYKWNGRIAIYTGLPSVMGWRWHQVQQRTLENMGRQVDMRVANVNAFYTTTDVETALRILRFYGVQYIVVSDMERAYYAASSLEKFDTMVELGMLEVAFEYQNSRVYRVIAPTTGVPPLGAALAWDYSN